MCVVKGRKKKQKEPGIGPFKKVFTGPWRHNRHLERRRRSAPEIRNRDRKLRHRVDPQLQPRGAEAASADGNPSRKLRLLWSAAVHGKNWTVKPVVNLINPRVVIYARKMFIRLSTGSQYCCNLLLVDGCQIENFPIFCSDLWQSSPLQICNHQQLVLASL